MEQSHTLLQWIINFDLSNFEVSLEDFFELYKSKPQIVHKISKPDKFSGMCRCFDNDGYLIYEGYINSLNKREGHGIEYSKKGTMITYDGFWKNDKPVSRNRKIYNQEGQIIFSGTFESETQDPDFGQVYSSKNGKIIYAGYFKECKFDGFYGYVFNSEGKVLCCGNWCNGFPKNEGFKVFYKSGSLLYLGTTENKGIFYHDGGSILSKSTTPLPNNITPEFNLQNTTDEYELLSAFETKKILFANESHIMYKNIEICSIKMKNGRNMTKDYFIKSVNVIDSTSFEYSPNLILKKTGSSEKDGYIFDIYIMRGPNLLFKGSYDGQGYLKNGVQECNDDYKIHVDLEKMKLIGDQIIQYRNMNHYGCLKSCEVILEYKNITKEDNKKKFVECFFKPKIKLLEGYFKLQRIEESLKKVPQEQSITSQLSTNQNFEYIGHIKNFARNGYGVLYKDNISIEANWQNDKICGFVKVKLKNALVMIGRMHKYSIKENNAIDYRKIIENCYGIPKNYNEENGKLEIVSNMDKRNPEKRFTMLYYPNGQLMYCGNFTDDGPNGHGVSFDDDKGRFNCRRFGEFKDGQLHGDNCFDYTEVNNPRSGTFKDGEFLGIPGAHIFDEE